MHRLQLGPRTNIGKPCSNPGKPFYIIFNFFNCLCEEGLNMFNPYICFDKFEPSIYGTDWCSELMCGFFCHSHPNRMLLSFCDISESNKSNNYKYKNHQKFYYWQPYNPCKKFRIAIVKKQYLIIRNIFSHKIINNTSRSHISHLGAESSLS